MLSNPNSGFFTKLKQNYWKHVELYPRHTMSPEETKSELIAFLTDHYNGAFITFPVFKMGFYIFSEGHASLSYPSVHLSQCQCMCFIANLRRPPNNAHEDSDLRLYISIARIWYEIHGSALASERNVSNLLRLTRYIRPDAVLRALRYLWTLDLVCLFFWRALMEMSFG